MKKKLLIALFALLAQQTLPLYAQGTVQVVVRDENGKLVDSAPVYIQGTGHTKYLGGTEVPGTIVLALNAGEYTISSCKTEKHGDYWDRSASNKATIHVVDGENINVNLTLISIQNTIYATAYQELRPAGMTTAWAIPNGSSSGN